MLMKLKQKKKKNYLWVKKLTTTYTHVGFLVEAPLPFRISSLIS